jgi:hypothetical protein
MKNNIFTFGNTTWKQFTGTAMGTPPAPPRWVTLYFALCEETVIPQFGANLTLYHRYIDDILEVWTITNARTDQQTWESLWLQSTAQSTNSNGNSAH